MAEMDLAAELRDCLDNIKGSGSFALFQPLTSFPNPGIYLKNGGTIGLPLSDRDAEAIVASSRAAPFGKGEQTIVDPTVRKTWEVSPLDFELKNKEWLPFLKTIVAKVSEGLGVSKTGAGVSAELYKMLLYDEGAMFKAHQDSEKAPGMFGTLVIALPSKHDGGEVRVSHAGKTELFETSKFSEFNASYLAWFSDVTHEVKPVLSGRRLVLTYNLCHSTLGSKELAANSNLALAKLNTLLPWWKDNCEGSLGYLLQHQYTDSSLSPAGLKGHDNLVVSHLREACAKHDFTLYLASLEVCIEGGCDEDEYSNEHGYHEITEECDRYVLLKRVIDLDGREIARDLQFQEEEIIQESAFDKMVPDDEDYSGFTGNEGVSATHFYRRTIVLIMPRIFRMEFLFPPSSQIDEYRSWRAPEIKRQDLLAYINRLSADLSTDSENSMIREDLKQLCKMVIFRTCVWMDKPAPANSWQRRPAPFEDGIILRVVIACLELDDKELLINACEILPDNIDASTFRYIGTALLRYGLKELLPKLTTRLSRLNNLSDRINIIEQLRNGMDEELNLTYNDDTPFRNWLKSEIDRAVTSPSIAKQSAQDGLLLARISTKIPPQEIFNNILPTVKLNAIYTPMAMAFSVALLKAGKSSEIAEEIAMTVFRDVVSDLAVEFTLQPLGDLVHERLKPIPPSYGYMRQSRPAKIPESIVDHDNSQNLASLLYQCQFIGLNDELTQMIDKIVLEARVIQIALFDAVYLPSLKALLLQLTEGNVKPLNSPFQRLFQIILSTYITRYVEVEPSPPQHWARPTVTQCQCNDCILLNQFLANPREKVGRFQMLQRRREHLEREVNSLGAGYSCTTERNKSPHTLVVTKTLGKHLELHKAWAVRCLVAKKHIAALGKENLRGWLEDLYEPIMSLSVPNLIAVAAQPQRSSQLPALGEVLNSSRNPSGRVLPPITRRKVPSNVIVIDD